MTQRDRDRLVVLPAPHDFLGHRFAQSKENQDV